MVIHGQPGLMPQTFSTTEGTTSPLRCAGLAPLGASGMQLHTQGARDPAKGSMVGSGGEVEVKGGQMSHG